MRNGSDIPKLILSGDCLENTRSNSTLVQVKRVLLHQMSHLSLLPHGTLSSAPPTLGFSPLRPKERHYESLVLAFNTIACFFPAYPNFAFLCLCLSCLYLPCPALPMISLLCHALPFLPCRQGNAIKVSLGNSSQVKGKLGNARQEQ